MNSSTNNKCSPSSLYGIFEVPLIIPKNILHNGGCQYQPPPLKPSATPCAYAKTPLLTPLSRSPNPLHLSKKTFTASPFGATQALYLRKNAFTPSVITNYFSQTPFQAASRPRTCRASPAHNDLKNRETSGQLPHRSQVLPSSGNQRYP